MDELTKNKVLDNAVQLAAAYMQQNKVDLAGVSELLNCMCQIVAEANRNSYYMGRSMATTPAVPISESVQEDYIVCLEDGKHLQMLKRHLKTMYNMTIDQYRERWNLPQDYPVVAPSYARRRSQIARNTGLGLTGRRGRRRAGIGLQGSPTEMGIVVNR